MASLQDSIPSGSTSLPHLRVFLFQLSNAITNEEYEGIAFLCGDDVSASARESIRENKSTKKPLALFGELLKKKLIAQDDLCYLKDIFKQLDRIDLLTEVEKYEKRLALRSREQTRSLPYHHQTSSQLTIRDSQGLTTEADTNRRVDVLFEEASTTVPKGLTIIQDGQSPPVESASVTVPKGYETSPNTIQSSNELPSNTVPKVFEPPHRFDFDLEASQEEQRPSNDADGEPTAPKSIVDEDETSRIDKPALWTDSSNQDTLSIESLNAKPVATGAAASLYFLRGQPSPPLQCAPLASLDKGSLAFPEPPTHGAEATSEAPGPSVTTGKEVRSLTSAVSQRTLEQIRTNEDLRKKLKNKDCETARAIHLYNYQLELASYGLQGKNNIICAPTGSGKTLTAGHVIQKLHATAQKETRTFKALFVVCIRNLIEQQTLALKQMFNKEEGAKVVGIGETARLKAELDKYDIVVLTAQILVNCLKEKEVQLEDIDLLIMDECHHTIQAHPYNVIMQHYHQRKRANPDDRRLPHVMGLTASLGVGSSEDNPLDHYILLCANLDSESISHVQDKDNQRELLQHNPKPQKNQIIPEPPRDPYDMFILTITIMMKEIEKKTPFQGTSRTLASARSTQIYENWIVSQRMEAEKTDSQECIIGCKALQELNTALMFYDDLQARDIINMLFAHFQKEYQSENPTEIEEFILKLYDEHQVELMERAEQEQIQENAKLDRLCQLLHDLFTTNRESRGIILARTRRTVDGLLHTVRDHPDLKGLVFAGKLVGQGSKEGTMTDTEQEQTLLLFRLGPEEETQGINLLVATDVAQEGLDMPKCNFVIRYNFVSNEIGAVQARGRARAKNSECYLIVNKGSINERRELQNLEREYLMMEALEDIAQIPGDQLPTKIKDKQEELWRKQQDKETQKQLFSSLEEASQIDIHCKQCKDFLCHASDMRHRLSNYVVSDPAFLERVDTEIWKTRREFRYDSQIGSAICKNRSCRQQLGPEILYKDGASCRAVALSKDKVMWKKHTEAEYHNIKQWSKVPFTITEGP